MLATGNTANLPAAPGAIVTTSGVIAFSIVATFVLEGEEHEVRHLPRTDRDDRDDRGRHQLARGGARRDDAASPPSRPPPPPPPPPANPAV